MQARRSSLYTWLILASTALVTLIATVGWLDAVQVGGNDMRVSDMATNGDIVYDARDAATAYNATNNTFLVVWYSDDTTPGLINGEDEIWGQFIDGDGNEIGTNDFRISFQGPDGNGNFDADTPAVAWNSTDNEFLVVWRGDLIVGEDEVFGQIVDGATGALIGSAFRISDMGPDGVIDFDVQRPSVAYNATDNEYFVVWQGDDATNSEDEIWGQRLTAAGIELGIDVRLSTMGLDGDGSFDAVAPDIVWNSIDNEYLVVWSGDRIAGEDEIFGQLVSFGGVEQGVNDFRISDMGSDGVGIVRCRATRRGPQPHRQ